MCQTVVVRNVQSSERVCDQAGQGARTGENDADTIACRVCEKMQALLRDSLSLLCCVRTNQKRSAYGSSRCTSHFFLTEQAVGNLIQRQRYRLRFAKRFFPSAHPRFVNVACCIAWVVQKDGRVLRGKNGCLQQRPERPVDAIKSCHQYIGKERRTCDGPIESSPISSVNQFETAIREPPMKSRRDLT